MKKILLILFISALINEPIPIDAQTRLYTDAITPSVSPGVNANWNVTTGNVLVLASQFADRSTPGALTSGNTGAAAVRKLLIRQFVSQPLIAQTINGTLTGQVRMSMSNTTSRTGEGFAYFRIVNPDGTIASEVGTLTTTALTTTTTNRTLIALTLTSLVITAGQRFCIDLGWNYSTGSNTGTTGQANVTAAGGNIDLPVDNTTTTGSRPYLEFSQTILFQYHSNGFF